MPLDTIEWAHPAHCGEDLEYDPQFLALQQAAMGKREQQFGTTIIAAEPPDWHQVEKIATALLTRTCDIRILVSRAQACAEQYGLARYAQELQTIAQALEQHWDNIHPRASVDDDEVDPLPRMNALAALGDATGGARSLRDAVLIKNEYGTARLRDAQALLEGSPAAANVQYPGGRTRLVEDLQTALVLEQVDVMAVPVALRALVRIRETVGHHLGQAWIPDLVGIERTLNTVVHALDIPADSGELPDASLDAMQVDALIDAQASDAGLSDDLETYGLNGELALATKHQDGALAQKNASSAQANGASSSDAAARRAERDIWRHATIHSRTDAVAMLEKVTTYFQQNEPSHPAPLLIRRIQQLIPLDFYDIVKNLAPQGLSEVESIMARNVEGERQHS